MKQLIVPLALFLGAQGASASGAPAPADYVITPGAMAFLETDQAFAFDSLGQMFRLDRGLLVVDDFILGDGAVLKATGPLPLRVHALGRVQISGVLDLSGLSAKNVAGTSVLPQPGAPGNLGGGRGGDAHANESSSTPSGSRGHGPRFAALRSGGGGGETGFGSQLSDPAERRGAGGAGGVFGPDVSATTPAIHGTVGLAAQPGSDGSPDAAGALGTTIPLGGALGRSPFADGDPSNDFWGVCIDPLTGDLVIGELRSLWAGSGGGGAGDSVDSPTFPAPSFFASKHDSGGAGGGGAGGLHIRARGVVSLVNSATGAQGSIRANGGSGAQGQLVDWGNQFFLESGAGGGGGSGGHIVIESLRAIDLGAGIGVIQARGGAGGPATDAQGTGKGGDGGPGIVQLHSPLGHASILSNVPLDEAVVPAPRVLLPIMQ